MTKPLTVTLNPALDKTISLPEFEIGGLNRLKSDPVTDPGGKGINVAKVLTQLDIKTQTTGFSAGSTGRMIENALDQLSIDYDFQQVSGDVRTNLKIVDESKGVTTEINEPGIKVLEDDLQAFEQKLTKLLTNTNYLVLSGSTPDGVDDYQYNRYINLAREHGVKTVLDASGPALKEGIKAKPHVIKPNIHELEELFETSFDSSEAIIKACQELVESGINIVVVSLGGDGALFVSQTETYQVKPFSITPQSTVGAGDSMVGAMVYALNQGYDFETLAKWATTAGTITASKPGTTVCTLEEIEAYVESVSVEKIGLNDLGRLET
ncbi:1-phosphofructokinase [Alkalibacillus salilacus]|uniref:Tagatose-6-phosphate kinase n=1 Tax=Alkalibacillus salilacus TaxID=284582 RepID=A0ABT9VEQ8_9BACI|nr:1-phosphofructokinase [Alkalibacillus salilacus]MDQ0159392.1 1-phosphofructokinase [Alkalibacillus salilacus]